MLKRSTEITEENVITVSWSIEISVSLMRRFDWWIPYELTPENTELRRLEKKNLMYNHDPIRWMRFSNAVFDIVLSEGGGHGD